MHPKVTAEVTIAANGIGDLKIWNIFENKNDIFYGHPTEPVYIKS